MAFYKPFYCFSEIKKILNYRNYPLVLVYSIGLSLFGCGCTAMTSVVGHEVTTVEEDKMAPSSRRGDRVRRREFDASEPIVRIGLMEEYDRIDFSVGGEFNVTDLKGSPILENVVNEQRWHVFPDTTKEARAVYSILLTAFAKRDAADKLRRSLTKKDYAARVIEVGTEVVIDGRSISNSVKYRVLVGRWNNERDARKSLDEFREVYAPRVVRQILKPSTGTIDLQNFDYSLAKRIKDGFRIVPKSDDCQVTLFEVREGTGFHWEREVDRTYPGILEVRVDHRGLLMALTELPLEEYLKGVVPAEMPASYPLESLKAQAIAARSETIAKVGLKHLNDPFDLCAHVHCQAYSGCSHRDERSSAAVDETRGRVLTMKSKVVESLYSACCGGHLEDKVNVWNPPPASHLVSHWDAPDSSAFKKYNLKREQDVEKWVLESPKVWCNTQDREDVPNILMMSERSFRWEVEYTRRELEAIINKKLGDDIGELLNIVPIRRGDSGRLMEIEIQGTKMNLRIQRELNIRNVLSEKYLRSACFSIEAEINEDGRHVTFKFKGAGWGHGVGMCQVGAGVMAHEKNDFHTILNHYYPGTSTEQVYGESGVEK